MTVNPILKSELLKLAGARFQPILTDEVVAEVLATANAERQFRIYEDAQRDLEKAKQEIADQTQKAREIQDGYARKIRPLEEERDAKLIPLQKRRVELEKLKEELDWYKPLWKSGDHKNDYTLKYYGAIALTWWIHRTIKEARKEAANSRAVVDNLTVPFLKHFVLAALTEDLWFNWAEDDYWKKVVERTPKSECSDYYDESEFGFEDGLKWNGVSYLIATYTDLVSTEGFRKFRKTLSIKNAYALVAVACRSIGCDADEIRLLIKELSKRNEFINCP